MGEHADFVPLTSALVPKRACQPGSRRLSARQAHDQHEQGGAGEGAQGHGREGGIFQDDGTYFQRGFPLLPVIMLLCVVCVFKWYAYKLTLKIKYNCIYFLVVRLHVWGNSQPGSSPGFVFALLIISNKMPLVVDSCRQPRKGGSLPRRGRGVVMHLIAGVDERALVGLPLEAALRVPRR